MKSETETNILNNSNRKRRRSRKPLADCTNLSQISSTNNSSSSSTFKELPILSSSLKKLPTVITINRTRTKTDAGSTTTPLQICSNAASNASAVSAAFSSTPPSRPSHSSSSAGIASDEIVEPRSVYTRRQSAADNRKRKGKEITPAKNYSPASKTQRPLDKMSEGEATRPSKSCTMHCKKKELWTQSGKDANMHALPQEFIEQQRAYFAEIDAFELSEEEVDSINELD